MNAGSVYITIAKTMSFEQHDMHDMQVTWAVCSKVRITDKNLHASANLFTHVPIKVDPGC